MADFLKVPKYVDDAPREYNSFTGGINNDPDNENVYDHELRDAVNTHYRNGNLERRLGAKQIKSLEYLDYYVDEHRDLVQGSFILPTRRSTYLVVVRDGFIYYGRVRVNQERVDLVPMDIDMTEMLEKEAYDPYNLSLGLPYYETEAERPPLNEVHDGFVFKAPERHFDSRHPALPDNPNIPHANITLPERDILILQNYRKVEGALFDDKLYLATGTRYLIVYEVSNESENHLRCEIVGPKEVNGFEYKHIGTNLLSPFPNQLIVSTDSLGISTIEHILVRDMMLFSDVEGQNTNMFLQTIMNYKSGTTRNDYRFKWEIKRGSGEWSNLNSFVNGLGMDALSYYMNKETLTNPDEEILIRCTFSDLFRTKSEEGRVRTTSLGKNLLIKLTP